MTPGGRGHRTGSPQHCPCHPPCFVRPILGHVLRRVREVVGGGGPREFSRSMKSRADGCMFMIRTDLPVSPGLGEGYRLVRSRPAAPMGAPPLGTAASE